jgi:hypothetical protein
MLYDSLWRNCARVTLMRILAAIVLVTFSILSVGCAAILQPAQQGEWSDFNNPKYKVSKDVVAEPEKPPAEK